MKLFVSSDEISEYPLQPCVDCGTDCRIDLYIVRDEVWAAAGMTEWLGGFLCTPCIEKRLGRRLRKRKDLLVWTTGPNGEARWKGFYFDIVKGYETSPEYREWLQQVEDAGGGDRSEDLDNDDRLGGPK